MNRIVLNYDIANVPETIGAHGHFGQEIPNADSPTVLWELPLFGATLCSGGLDGLDQIVNDSQVIGAIKVDGGSQVIVEIGDGGGPEVLAVKMD